IKGDVSDYSLPVVMGHELAGTVVESRHPDVKIGERVTVNPMLSCGTCVNCTNDRDKYCDSIEGIGHDIDGGYAEYIRMPKQGVDTDKLISVPVSTPLEELLFLEPLGCCINAMHETIFNKTVAVMGAGPIGLIFIQLLKSKGLEVYVFEPLPHRRYAAEIVGADDAFATTLEDINNLRDFTNGGVDTVISSTTNNAAVISLAFELVRKGGCINFFGLSPEGETLKINLEEFHYTGHKLMASWAFSRASLQESRQLILNDSLNFKPLLSDKFPLTQGLEAFENAISHRGIKTVLCP
ncbi:alcohol dehydrogenase catalytic domain-containing protein, partial [Candidatus Poribacteria bacterium]|nr:alcohol dehydrogenase catalytic domain-containing protein [Candidatus Poribacteria bacterium]